MKKLTPLLILSILVGCIVPQPATSGVDVPMARGLRQPDSPLIWPTLAYYFYFPTARYGPFERDCYMTNGALIFAALLMTDPHQRRKQPRCNSALVEAAQARARSMAEEGYFAHCDPTGKCANAYAVEYGCSLPLGYDPRGNNIESIGAGTSDPYVMYGGLLYSSSHVVHILALSPFFADQLDVGVGFYEKPGSPYTYYWSVLTAPCQTVRSGE